MRRFFSLCLLCILIVPLLLPVGASAWEQTLELASEAAILMDAETGQILFEKNAYEILYPASITKIMTGLLALEHGDEDQILTVSSQVIAQVPRTSSHIGLQVGETLTMEDALYALAISSANDAAVAIAEGISGSVAAFAELMNQEAEALGTLNSHFVNPNGLPSGEHYTTAYDMALITAKALKQPNFLRYFGSGAYVMPATNLSTARSLTSKNQFIDGEMACPGLLFSKTGWTSAAQGTLVSAAKRGQTTLIAVTLKSPMLEDKYLDTQKLFDYGFDSFRRFSVDEDFVLEQLHGQGLEENAELENFESYSLLVPREVADEDIRLIVPGGFAPGSGVTTVPASVVAKDASGEILLLRDDLLTFSLAQAVAAEPEALLADISSQPHTLGWIPLGIVGVAVAAFLVIGIVEHQKRRK